MRLIYVGPPNSYVPGCGASANKEVPDEEAARYLESGSWVRLALEVREDPEDTEAADEEFSTLEDLPIEEKAAKPARKEK